MWNEIDNSLLLSGQITVSSGMAKKNVPSLKLSDIPSVSAVLTASASSPGSKTTVIGEMMRRQLLPGAHPVSMSMIRSIVTGYSSV
mmetsp:Transcript_10174/g.22485  ORF Transcript_10174/g.22485 Transcript_10174/m.22485 type:complete len:86 (+) Transcript_10174:1769-2026(+)